MISPSTPRINTPTLKVIAYTQLAVNDIIVRGI